MKSALSRYNGLLAVVLTACGLLYVLPAAAVDILNAEKCNNNTGRSLPGMSMPYCTKVDCCNWYQHTHIHNLEFSVPGNKNKTITYSYTPGFTDGCTDTLTLSTSTNGSAFTEQQTRSVVSKRDGGGWTKYTASVVVRDAFQYVKIEIPHCYNDYSSVDSITW